MELHAVPQPDTALGARHGEVDGVRDHVGEVVQLQGALVGDDRTRITQWQPADHHVLVRAGGEMGQPVEAAPNVQVAATRSRVVAQRAAVHSGAERLRRGEVTGLGLRVCVDRIMVNARQ